MKMFVRLIAVACVLSALAPAQNTPKRPITFADLQALKRVSDPQISPSGKWVLFSVTDVSLEKNSKTNHLWAVPLDGSAKERQLTTLSGESNGRFSPDGKRVMYSSAEGGSSQIWVAPWNDTTGTLGAGHVVTALETDADGGLWAPDSKHFLFVSSVFPDCESHAPMGPQHNEEEAACNAQKDAALAKSPVKAQIFDHLLYRHWNAYVGPKHSHIFYASVDGTHDVPTDLTPASVIGDHEAPTFSLGGPLGYAISPDGKEIAYVTNLDKVPAESTNNDIFTLQLGAEPNTAKKVSTSPGSDDGPQYSPDGKWLAWRSQAKNGFESDQFRLAVMDRFSGTVHSLMTKAIPRKGPLLGVPEFGLWIDEFVWTHDSQYFLFVSGEKGEAPVYRVNIEGTDLHRLGKVQGEWSGIAETPDQMIVGSLMKVSQPTELAVSTQQDMDDTTRTFNLDFSKPTKLVDLTSKERPAEETTKATVEPRVLTHLNEVLLSALTLSPIEPFWFTGAAETKVEGFILKPPNFDPAKKYPVKFLMHGGPQTAWGDSWSYRWNWELLAANGYVVIGINRRGSTGYGQKFVDEVSGDWGGRAYTDLMKGLDFAEAKYPFIDKSRECALGASYGGFMANWVLTHTDRFTCIVTHDGMYNPQSAFGSTEEMWFNEWEFRPLAGPSTNPGAPSSRPASSGAKAGPHDAASAVVEQTRPAHPWDYYSLPASQDPFRKYSPMQFIKNAHTPTLVIHSQRDYRLDVSEGFQLFTALQVLGVPSKMLYFPDEGHWVLKPQNSRLWYETVNDWCDQWTHTNKYAADH
jgi:dipeptidyl aminopeptidase/acylaminoacyl peptidase